MVCEVQGEVCRIPRSVKIDLIWSTFTPTIVMTAVRAVISLVYDLTFDGRNYDRWGAYLGTKVHRPVYV